MNGFPVRSCFMGGHRIGLWSSRMMRNDIAVTFCKKMTRLILHSQAQHIAMPSKNSPRFAAIMQIRLVTLGTIQIVVEGRELPDLQPHRARLALLVFLAVERRVRRDAILAMFWPEADNDSARHSLRQAI